jgi:uncharacterized protein
LNTNPKKIFKSIQALSGWRESAFLLALAERALPNAALLLDSIDALDLDPEVYPKGLVSLMDASWLALVLVPDEERIIEALDSVVANVVVDDLDNYGVLPSNDCMGLWEQALLSGLNRDKKRAPEGSQISLATVTQFIEFSEGDGLSEDQLVRLFSKHDLVVREFSFQEECADILRASQGPSAGFIKGLRELAQDEGISNIGIALE